MSKKIISFLTAVIFTTLLAACGVQGNFGESKPISHQSFDALLKQYVTLEGWVDYRGLMADRSKLDHYLELLSSHHPNEKNWSRNERLAYWINAYNAFTLQLILDHYPVESIKDIKKGIPFVNTVWDIKFIKIEGKEYDLNNIEHGIIRSEFNEPRIHFAVNCASYSCPVLQNFAYTAGQLDEQLDHAAKEFLNDPRRNKIQEQSLQLSKILSWYSGDFKQDGKDVMDYVRQYSNMDIAEDPKVDYLDYDWRLNDKRMYD
ncbi:MAG TPA: DUF547 domain-containing protein [Saprospiraceae bacterium]|nr:DUF547 domain-containing protein [Saprospiraceae bacterium]